MTQPKHQEGDVVPCPRCRDKHRLVCVMSPLTGKKSESLMYIECGDRKLLAAVDNRLLQGMHDVSNAV